MKYFYSFLLFFILCLPLYGQADSATGSNTPGAETFSFQGLTWDSTKKEVKKTFPEFSESGTDLFAIATIGRLEAVQFFFFNSEPSLKKIGLSFTDSHSNRNIYIEDYNYINQLLIQKYGEPTSKEIKWRDNLYKDDPSDYGFAVSLGDLIYTTTWVLKDTTILHVLNGDNYEISHLLVYQPLYKEDSSAKDSLLDKL